ncbi:MAG: SDR family NAD(P)-dependent oxidoreductase [Myxococcota bacterium]
MKRRSFLEGVLASSPAVLEPRRLLTGHRPGTKRDGSPGRAFYVVAADDSTDRTGFERGRADQGIVSRTGLRSRAMQIRLDGKVAIVTGGSKGIGLGIARAFVEAGAQVMITSRKAEACAAAVAPGLEGAHFGRAGHVGREEDAERVVEATLERLGSGVLVNNAATNPYAGPTIRGSARWDKIRDEPDRADVLDATRGGDS